MIRLFVLLFLTAAAAWAQTDQAEPRFEAVKIVKSPHSTIPLVRGPFFGGDHYELRFATMLDLIRMAYDLDPEKVKGGPSWLELDRYDVFAKVPPGSTAQSRRLMLRSMLADRFKLVLHDDKQSMPAYALTAAKANGLKEAAGDGNTGCNFNMQNTPPPPPPSQGGGRPIIQLPVIQFSCKSMSMAAFATTLPGLAGAGQYFTNKPVSDQTGLKGDWDFNFKFTPKVPAGIQVTGESIPLFDALEKQLGLKLQESTLQLPVVVVDSVNEQSTEDSPEILKAFPPLPTEFEVADLKPSAPNGGRGAPTPDIKNGRVYLPGISLQNLIMVAWDLNETDRLINAPKWLNDDRYDLLAKAPADVAIGDLTAQQRSAVPINIDALRPMLQSLIKDRFQLKAHNEERPLTTYVLTAAKPKLSKADPNERSAWHEGVNDAGKSKNGNPSLGRLVTCTNVTMAQFADMLPGIAPGYVHTNVADATGLEGGWDFTFSFSPVGATMSPPPGGGRGGDGASSGDNEASTPNGAISLFDAISKQLGLKLETQKRPVQVLVIDSIDRKPTEN